MVHNQSLDSEYNVRVAAAKSTTASVISNSLSTTASIIAPSNPNRKGISISNTLLTDVFVDYSNTVSSTTYTVKLAAGDYWESPFNFTGDIYGILGSGTGSIQIREYV